MKKYFKRSLNRRLSLISIVVFIPMFCLAVILMVSLMKASHAYSEITHSVSYANQYVKDFKERIDYSMYLAVIGNMGMEELGNEEKTVNGIVTVNPYEYISEMEQACDHMAEVATVNINKNQIQRLKSSLKSLRKCVGTLEAGIKGNQKYEENKAYLDENINNLTTLIQTGIQDYIYTETTHLDEIKEHLDAKNANTLAVSIGIFAVTIFLSLVNNTVGWYTSTPSSFTVLFFQRVANDSYFE